MQEWLAGFADGLCCRLKTARTSQLRNALAHHAGTVFEINKSIAILPYPNYRILAHHVGVPDEVLVIGRGDEGAREQGVQVQEAPMACDSALYHPALPVVRQARLREQYICLGATANVKG